jgi:uncharacterized protein (DUF736 family)
MENTTSNTSQDNNSKSQNEEIGAFWKRTSRNNMTYLAGHIKVPQSDGTEKTEKVVVFSNQHKKAENQPDYRVYISNTEARTNSSQKPQSTKPQETEQEELL